MKLIASHLRDFADFLPENKRDDFNATIDDLLDRLATAHEANTALNRAMENGPTHLAEAATPNEVWCVANKTSSVLFESQELARAYVAQFGASTGGGFSITNLQVFRSPSGPASDK